MIVENVYQTNKPRWLILEESIYAPEVCLKKTYIKMMSMDG